MITQFLELQTESNVVMETNGKQTKMFRQTSLLGTVYILKMLTLMEIKHVARCYCHFCLVYAK